MSYCMGKFTLSKLQRMHQLLAMEAVTAVLQQLRQPALSRAAAAWAVDM
jgi:hypothetical protein